MTTTELPMPAAVVAELEATLDERTREILAQRRGSTVIRRRGWLIRRALAGADLLGLTIAFLLAVWLLGDEAPRVAEDRVDRQLEVLLFLLTLPGWIVMAKIYGLYDRDEERTDHSTTDDFAGVFHMITLGAWGTFLIAWGTNVVAPQIDKIIGFWALAILLVCALRAAARAYCRGRVEYLQNTIIVGAGDVGQLIARKYLSHPEYGINLVGFVDAEPKERREDLGHLTLLGGPERISELIELLDVERVVIAFSNDRHDESLELVRQLKDFEVQIDIVPRLFEIVGPSVSVHEVEGIPIVGLPPLRLSRSSLLLKRTLDVCLAGLGLVVLAPVMLVIALLIRCEGAGPVLYRSVRIGRGGKEFELFKFRTMRVEACRGPSYGGASAETVFADLMNDPARREEFERTHKLARDPRVTRFGELLRTTSLDEIPQLLNVALGHLSLVGPRPITADEYRDLELGPAVELGYWVSSNLQPGVTGYWQIKGRSSTDYADRLRLDLAYVSGWSLGLDLAILAKTGRALLSRHGAY